MRDKGLQFSQSLEKFAYNNRLLLSGLEKGRKDLAKCQKRCGKDAIFYIQVFGHRPPRKASHRRINACGRDRRWGKATGRVTRTAPKPANFLLSRRQEQKKWESGSKESNAMRRGGKREVQWAIAILNSMADGQALTP